MTWILPRAKIQKTKQELSEDSDFYGSRSISLLRTLTGEVELESPASRVPGQAEISSLRTVEAEASSFPPATMADKNDDSQATVLTIDNGGRMSVPSDTEITGPLIAESSPGEVWSSAQLIEAAFTAGGTQFQWAANPREGAEMDGSPNAEPIIADTPTVPTSSGVTGSANSYSLTRPLANEQLMATGTGTLDINGSAYVDLSLGDDAQYPYKQANVHGNGGELIHVTVFSGGIVSAYENAIVTGAEINNGGRMIIQNGCRVFNTVINSSGYVEIWNTAQAAVATIYNGGKMTVQQGGSATSVLVHSGGVLEMQTATQLTGTIRVGGMMTTQGGMNTGSADIILDVAERRNSDGIIIDNLPNLIATKSFTINVELMQSGNYLLGWDQPQTFRSRSAALTVDNIATGINLSVDAAPQHYGFNSYSLRYENVNLVLSITQDDLPVKWYYNGSLVGMGTEVSNLTVNKTGALQDTLTVAAGGAANLIQIGYQGSMQVGAGGTVNGVSLSAGGQLQLETDTRLSGTIINHGGEIQVTGSGTVDGSDAAIWFQLGGLNAGNAYLFTNLDAIENVSEYYVSLTYNAESANPDGRYRLATGAAGFANPDYHITVAQDFDVLENQYQLVANAAHPTCVRFTDDSGNPVFKWLRLVLDGSNNLYLDILAIEPPSSHITLTDADLVNPTDYQYSLRETLELYAPLLVDAAGEVTVTFDQLLDNQPIVMTGGSIRTTVKRSILDAAGAVIIIAGDDANRLVVASGQALELRNLNLGYLALQSAGELAIHVGSSRIERLIFAEAIGAVGDTVVTVDAGARLQLGDANDIAVVTEGAGDIILRGGPGGYGTYIITGAIRNTGSGAITIGLGAGSALGAAQKRITIDNHDAGAVTAIAMYGTVDADVNAYADITGAQVSLSGTGTLYGQLSGGNLSGAEAANPNVVLRVKADGCLVSAEAGITGTNQAIAGKTDVSLVNGTRIYSEVYAGGKSVAIGAGTSLLASSATLNGLAFGGSLNADIGGNVNITVEQSSINGLVFGGSRCADGGMYQINGQVSLEMTGSTLDTAARIYGAGWVNNGSLLRIRDDVNLIVGSGTTGSGTASIYGGGLIQSDGGIRIQGNLNLSLAGDGSFMNVFAGARVEANANGTLQILGSVTTTIAGGTFAAYVGNGSQLFSGTTQQGASTLTITGGTFNGRVYAGGFSQGGTVLVNGNTYLNISGGVFNDAVFGGNSATNSANGANGLIAGSTYITIDTSVNSVAFNHAIYGGSIGNGVITGGTNITFTGLGSNLLFGDGGTVSGESQNSKVGVMFITDEKTLTFDNFSGNFGASIYNNAFSRLGITGQSQVELTRTTTNLTSVNTWNFELFSDAAVLIWESGVNNFAGDTLNLNFDSALLDAGSSATVLEGGGTGIINGWKSFRAVTFDVAGNVYNALWSATEQAYLCAIGDEQWKLGTDFEQRSLLLSKLA